jgi:hypothetical protein
MRLRSELGVSDEQCLSHELALGLVPRCEVWALKNIPNVPFEHVIHFRNMARQFGAFAYKDKDGDYRIVFNDSYPPRVCENANNFANIEASYRIRGSDR